MAWEKKGEIVKNIYHKVVLKKIRFQIEIIRYKKLSSKYLEEIDIDKMPLFEYIELETLNRCNGLCSFCPVNAGQPQRPYAKMQRKLFEKIIDELAFYKYTGSINLFSNNEPFLDDRIIEWMEFAKKKLPNAHLVMYTNGTVLTLEKFLKTIQYTDELVIDNYSDVGVINENLRDIKKYIDTHKEETKCVAFYMRMQNEKLTSRGGEAPNRQGVVGINAPCFYPYKQMIVRPDGKCSLCCNDALGKYTLGDVNIQTLKEIWHGDEYKRIRKEMKLNNRRNLELCNQCDTRAIV